MNSTAELSLGDHGRVSPRALLAWGSVAFASAAVAAVVLSLPRERIVLTSGQGMAAVGILVLVLAGAFLTLVRPMSKRLHGRLLEVRAYADAIIRSTADGIIVIDESGRIEASNPAAQTMFGLAEEEMLESPLAMVIPSVCGSSPERYLRDAVRTDQQSIVGAARDVIGRRKDGSEFPMELAVSKVRLDDQRVFIVAVRDTTQRHELDAMKDEFISIVSHELRTPLASIQGSLGLLQGGLGGPLNGEARKLIDICLNNTHRLTRLIDDILDVQKLETSRQPMAAEEVELGPLVRETIETNRNLARQFDVRIDWTGGEAAVWVEGDPDRLIQVMTNLIGNAVKFSPAGSAVGVELASNGSWARVAVSDQGPGIPEETRPQLFEKFAQLRNPGPHRLPGTGLGLYIARTIIERHGGRIWVDSQEGAGSTFVFELPMIPLASAGVGASPAAAPSAVGEERGPIVASLSRPFEPDELVRVIERAGLDGHEGRCRILYVDSDRVSAALVCIALADSAQVHPVHEIAPALRSLDAEGPDLVIAGLADVESAGWRFLVEAYGKGGSTTPLVLLWPADVNRATIKGWIGSAALDGSESVAHRRLERLTGGVGSGRARPLKAVGR